jgi:integrase
MVLIAVLTGLRRGELFALRWSVVDFERKLIRVSSIRTIPMGEALEAIFLALRPKNAAANALVFASRSAGFGTYWSAS